MDSAHTLCKKIVNVKGIVVGCTVLTKARRLFACS